MKGGAIIWIILILFLLVFFGFLTWDTIFAGVKSFFVAIFV